MPKVRHSVGLQSVFPLLTMLVVLPLRSLCLQKFLSTPLKSLVNGSLSLQKTALTLARCSRILALLDALVHLPGLCSCFSQADCRVGTQTNIFTLIANFDPKHPASMASRDSKV